DDDVLGRGELAPVEEATVPEGVPAAVDPHHDRQTPGPQREMASREGRGPDVQIETVLGPRWLTALHVVDAAEGSRELRAGGREAHGLARSAPRVGRQRCAPAERAHRGLRERDAEPGVSPVATRRADQETGLHGAAAGWIGEGG